MIDGHGFKMNNKPLKQIDIREDYSLEELEERYKIISAQQDITKEYKKWATDLWMKVIQRAIDDILLIRIMESNGEEITEEMKEWKESAESFLFDEDYYIPFDDYEVTIECPKCGSQWKKQMSTVVAEKSRCSKCKYKISTKYIDYRIISKDIKTEISLEELISLWGIENITLFREGCKKRIDDLFNKHLERNDRKQIKDRNKFTKKI
jgi:predicted RNA-binding Zn-ribbon protein involved in translation (DUF1610 family)